MPVATVASSPSTMVTEVPGRFSPGYVVDTRSPALAATSSALTGPLAFLPRTETADATFTTPTTPIDELGTDFHVGEIDDLPDSKLTLSCYDAGGTVVSLITGKDAPASATTTYGYNDFNTASVDVIRQFADPNGKVFASTYQGDLVIDDFGFSLKVKAQAMENYSLSGFNMMKFRGFVVSKAYIALSGDVSGNSLPIGTTFGTDEGPVALPVPSGSQPPSYWIQRGSLNFLKVARYRAATGWVRIPEVTGTPVAGQCKYNTGPKTLTFAAGDIALGDVYYVTFCSYKSNLRVGQLATPGLPTLTPAATGGTLAAGTTYNYRIAARDQYGVTIPGGEAAADASTTGSTSKITVAWTAVSGAASYDVFGRIHGSETLLTNVTGTSYVDTGALTPAGAIPSANSTGIDYTSISQNSPDTSDPAAVPTRLTPFTISGNNIPRGQGLDCKMSLKRERADGIGDVDGLYGPSSAPEVSVSLDVKKTDFGINAILETGSPTGSDTGGAGSVAGDFYDPNYATRSQLSSNVALVATIYDPRNAGVVLKTYTLPAIVLTNDNENASTKNAVTVKFTGTDRTGNMTVAVIKP